MFSKNSEPAATRFNLSEGGNIYTRLINPTNDVLEKRIAALEGGVAALALASGSAVISYTIQNIALAGDHIVADKNFIEEPIIYFQILCLILVLKQPLLMPMI